jgi:FixJ family two-component response regulator
MSHTHSLKQILVLIDDDPLIHATWSMVAQAKGHQLQCFTCIEDFNQASIPLDVPVYVDYHLGEKSGADIIKRLAQRGYDHLYITTGRKPTDIIKEPEMKGVFGKDYPEQIPHSSSF